ncbi:FtsJ-domain-containing protein [Rhizoclosmatium globosum]|uniref:FtsJ-domain-containing protein n=1 Tax=Rhizoclosmatium globosum TaxID=329046 RepID=A0A1Y2CW43_9FUNG|nr:FtsJ-domain-containing protein [Rhizoclosmatium globosum]|eukprot:ORY51044.1 FtsJ-domain-containing protein [Rhizoclosmatium globosum]
MGVSKKHAKGRLDKFYHMAKEQGYRARSAFKLIQLNKKYAFLEKAKVLVDLCAAPGGWLQVAQKYMPKSSLIIGLDLAPIKPIPGVITHVEDITTSKCRATLKGELKTWKADVFLHDGAPNVGVSWIQDAFTQNELVLRSLQLASEFMVPNGVFVTKVFRSKDYNKLLWVFNQLFESVEATKPSSSRNVSAEIFVVCRGYKAPKKIDPRLLDPKFVFKEIDDNAGEEEDPKKIKERQSAILNDLFHPEKRKRHRDGYADGATMLFTSTPVSEFIRSSEYITILAKNNRLEFNNPNNDPQIEEDHKIIKNSVHTTKEVIADIADLRNLGKKDFKDLIRWRETIRISMGLDRSKEEIRKQREAAKEEQLKRLEEEKNKPETEETIAAELARQQEELEQQKKKEKRKSRERKAKQLLRLRLGMETPMDIGMEADMGGIDGLQHDDGFGDEFAESGGSSGLFKVDGARRARQRVKELGDDASSITGSMLGKYDPAAEEDEDEDYEDDDSDIDSDDEIARKVGALEGDLDQMYESFTQRRLEKDPKARVKRKNDGKEAFEEWYGVEWEKKMQGIEDGATAKKAVDDSSDDESLNSDWGDDSDTENAQSSSRNKKRKSRNDEVFEDDTIDEHDGALSSAALSKKAKVFFDNPLFKMASGSSGMFAKEMGIEDMDDDDEEDIKKAAKEAKSSKKDKKDKKKKAKKSKDDVDILSDSDDDKGNDKKGFEVVRASKADEDFNQTKGNFILDTAEKYSLAQKLVTKSGKRDVIDDAFNRRPTPWFSQDENRHNKINLPVTKEAMDLMRQKLRAMDARPIKKVAEAKFRQKMRAQNRLEKAKKKASAIADDEDTPELSKLKDAAKVMSKALKKKPKSETKLVVARHQNKGVKGRPKGIKGRYKMVDGVMKKEMKRQKGKDKAAKKGKRNK